MFSIKIVTVDGVVYDGEASSASVPSSEGQLTVLSSHASLLTLLESGEIVVSVRDGDEQYIFISGGLMEVTGDVVTVLAEAAERDTDIDLARAEDAQRRASEEIAKAESSASAGEAIRALARASARIKVAKHRKKHTEQRVV